MFQPEMKGQIEAKVTNLSDVSGTLMEKGDPGNVEDPVPPPNALFQQVGPQAWAPCSLQRFTPLLQQPPHHHLKAPPHPVPPPVSSFL